VLSGDDFILAALAEDGTLKPDAVERATRHALEHNVSTAKALVDLGLISPRDLAIARAQTNEYPFVDLAQFEPDFDNTKLLPQATAESLEAFPLFVLPSIVTVGMVDPLDLRAVDQLRTILKADIEPVVCEPEALRRLIERAYSLSNHDPAAKARPAEAKPAAGELTTGKEPIVAAVNQIIAQGIDLGASDIHIGPDEHELHLRYRVDGALHPHQGPGLGAHSGIIQRLKVMASLDLTQTRRPQDGKFRFSHNGRTVDLRLSIIPTVCGENAVLRVLSSAASIRGFQELGFPPDDITRFEQLIEAPYGMILVTGPTGSGKTTTLYTALKRLNSSDINIMTIEDPVEIRMPLVRQVQVHAEIGMTFAGALRSMLRQDPDVVFVGEIRDEETARISVQAALTGHLVLSSLHTNDAAGAIPRLKDLGCPAFAINAALLGVIAQRLVRRSCPECSKPATPDALMLARFGLKPGAEGQFVKGAGCPRCASTGFKGRVGLYELLSMAPEVRKLVESGAAASAIRAAAERSNPPLVPMWRDGLRKARLGLTTLDEVIRVVAVAATQDDTDAVESARLAA
jgi:type IV pilus assembly protein PilB